MKIPVISLLFVSLAGLACADVPKKAPLGTYSKLWNDSPFTTKPPPPEAGPENNPLEDYALLGVSPIGEGKYRVTMINKKKPDDRVMVYSDSTTSDFKILKVVRKAGDPLGTVVKMSSGKQEGTVSFDEKLLTIAPPPPPNNPNQKPVPGQNGQPGQNQTGQAPVPQPVPQPVDPRQPRPRVVPPPTMGGQPTPQPQAQPNAQQMNNASQRPQRRRN